MATTSAVLTQMASSFENNEGDQPGFVTIFQTRDNFQIMLPELGNRYALQAYFHFYKVTSMIDERVNAEDMSPDGLLPFIRHGNKLVSGFDMIIEYINTKYGIEQSNRADIKALTQLFSETFTKAELFYTWLSPEIYDQFTKSHYPYGRPWPLNVLLCWFKKREIASKIGSTEKIDLNFEQVCSNFASQLSGKNQFIFGNNPCELDTLIYGHIKAIHHYRDTYKTLYGIIAKFPDLLNFVERIDELVAVNP